MWQVSFAKEIQLIVLFDGDWNITKKVSWLNLGAWLELSKRTRECYSWYKGSWYFRIKNGPNAKFEHKEKELGYKSVPQLNTLPRVGEVQRIKELNSKHSQMGIAFKIEVAKYFESLGQKCKQ
jgi:hypothetical protein